MINKEILTPIQPQFVKVAFVSSCLPRKCGIATFTNDLMKSIDNLNGASYSEIIAMTDHGQSYDYPDKVKFEINQFSKTDYEQAAQHINQSSVDIVSIQHEFGLHTGPSSGLTCCLSAGAKEIIEDEIEIEDEHYLLSMLDNIVKPIVTTFHTILPSPNRQQMYVVRRIIKRSAAIVAMSEISRNVLIDIYDCPPEKAVVICHGVPDFEFDKTKKYQTKLNIKDANPMILSAGLLGPGKGLETIIQAMPLIIEKLPLAKLFIVGQTHPVILSNEGESYRHMLIKIIKKNNLTNNVEFVNRYLCDNDLQDYFQATDYFVTAYARMQQSTSGMLAWGISAGKICLSTPYQHAVELLSDGTGILVKQNSASAIADGVVDTFNNSTKSKNMRHKAYEKGHDWIWSNVATDYLRLFAECINRHKDIVV